MVKIERLESELSEKAVASLEREKAKASGSYNTPEVNEALQDMFYGKCYICENKKVTSWQIEHLVPHRGNKDLKFSWDNLFLSCAHCNNIKNDRFEPIWDCTKEDVDEHIAFRKEGYFGKDEKYLFSPLDDAIETQNTCKLLNEAYYGSTTQKQVEAKFIRKELRDELGRFKNYVRDYMYETGRTKDELLCTIRSELSASSPFAAFKRWLIRDNDKYAELLNCWK
ncbi:MAG: HNH endonuclease [Selenomonadaceae bacterium]|nr:HNH endonuclease [Selenomonadaceae bacterium]